MRPGQVFYVEICFFYFGKYKKKKSIKFSHFQPDHWHRFSASRTSVTGSISTFAELKFRYCWMKFCRSENHYPTEYVITYRIWLLCQEVELSRIIFCIILSKLFSTLFIILDLRKLHNGIKDILNAISKLSYAIET